MFSLPYPEHLFTVIARIFRNFAITAGVILGALGIGYFFFNLNLIQVVPWFWIIVAIAFAIAFIFAVLSLSRWSNAANREFTIWKRGIRNDFWRAFLRVVGIFLLTVILIVVVAIVLKTVLGGPVIDLAPYFEPILSFLK